MIVSTSGAEVVEPIGEMLGADRVIATRMEIVDGRYTGGIEYYAYAEEKARAIERARRRASATTSSDCYAYSDSVTDVPMLEAVGHPHAVNPDKELRRIAAAQGLAGAGLHQAGRAALAGCRSRPPSRPSPRWRSAASSRSAACSGPAPASAASAPDAMTRHARRRSQPLKVRREQA